MMTKRIYSLILAGLMLFCAVPSVVAEDQILPREYYGYGTLYQDLNAYGVYNLTKYDLASLWFHHEGYYDGLDWPQQYLGPMEHYLSLANSDTENLILHSYEWKNGVLHIDYETVHQIKYKWTYCSTGPYGYILQTPPHVYIPSGQLALAVTNKSDGSLVEIIKSKKASFYPEYQSIHPSYINPYINTFKSVEEANAAAAKDGLLLDYTKNCRKTAEMPIPKNYNPAIHDLTLYYTYAENDVIPFAPPSFSTPYKIQSPPGYFIDSGKLDFSYILKDLPTEEHRDRFEALLKNPVSVPAEKLEVYNISVLGNTLTFSTKTTGSIYANYIPSQTSSEEMVQIKDVYITAAIRLKGTNSLKGLQIIGKHIQSTEKFTDATLTLPEYFNPDWHELIFFRYTLDFYPDGDYSVPAEVPAMSVSDPVVIYVNDYIFGDADHNGTVNLSDITLMLKHLASWSNVKLDLSLIYPRHPNPMSCYYNMPAITATLKIIAGWDTDTLGLDSDVLSRCSSVKYYYDTAE